MGRSSHVSLLGERYEKNYYIVTIIAFTRPSWRA